MADPGRNGDRTDFKICGRRDLPCRLAPHICKGVAKYETDIVLPNMLFGKSLKSPYARARIKSMDTSKAEALSGVKAVVRWDDPDVKAIPRLHWSNYSVCGLETCIDDSASQEGEDVGVFVAAETEELCDEALKLVDIEWEVLPHVIDYVEANQPDAPVCMPEQNTESNLWRDQVWEEGDVEAGFAEATHIVEYDYTFSQNSNFIPQPTTIISYWKQDDASFEGPTLYATGNDLRMRVLDPARKVWNLPDYKVRYLNTFGNSCY